MVDGVRKAESSVEELIVCEIKKHFTFDQVKTAEHQSVSDIGFIQIFLAGSV
jgi:hypothetical protein